MTAISPIATVLARLDALGLREHDGMAQCPAHDDREPSLRLSVGDDGRALLHCHAGCSIDEVLGALGLAASDLFAESRSRSRGGLDLERPAPSPPRSSSRSCSGSRSGEFSGNAGDSERADGYIARCVRDVEMGREALDFSVPLNLTGLAPQASMLRSLAARISIVMARALNHGDTEPTPLSVGLVALLMGKDPRNRNHRGEAWKARHTLVERKVIRWARRLPSKHEHWEGTDCYQPYGFDLAAVFAGGGASGVEPDGIGEVGEHVAGLDPPVEVGQETAVHRAVVGEPAPSAIRMVASGDAARTVLRGAGHGSDANRVVGGSAVPATTRDDPAADEFVAQFIEEFDAVELKPEGR